jgi:hypothetical protein
LIESETGGLYLSWFPFLCDVNGFTVGLSPFVQKFSWSAEFQIISLLQTIVTRVLFKLSRVTCDVHATD